MQECMVSPHLLVSVCICMCTHAYSKTHRPTKHTPMAHGKRVITHVPHPRGRGMETFRMLLRFKKSLASVTDCLSQCSRHSFLPFYVLQAPKMEGSKVSIGVWPRQTPLAAQIAMKASHGLPCEGDEMQAVRWLGKSSKQRREFVKWAFDALILVLGVRRPIMRSEFAGTRPSRTASPHHYPQFMHPGSAKPDAS